MFQPQRFLKQQHCDQKKDSQRNSRIKKIIKRKKVLEVKSKKQKFKKNALLFESILLFNSSFLTVYRTVGNIKKEYLLRKVKREIYTVKLRNRHLQDQHNRHNQKELHVRPITKTYNIDYRQLRITTQNPDNSNIYYYWQRHTLCCSITTQMDVVRMSCIFDCLIRLYFHESHEIFRLSYILRAKTRLFGDFFIILPI